MNIIATMELPTDDQVRAWVKHMMTQTTLSKIHKDLWPAIAMFAVDAATASVYNKPVEIHGGTITLGDLMEYYDKKKVVHNYKLNLGYCGECKTIMDKRLVAVCHCYMHVCEQCTYTHVCTRIDDEEFKPAVEVLERSHDDVDRRIYRAREERGRLAMYKRDEPQPTKYIPPNKRK
jgi:hypothetical protein